jgi:hypothetical protein
MTNNQIHALVLLIIIFSPFLVMIPMIIYGLITMPIYNAIVKNFKKQEEKIMLSGDYNYLKRFMVTLGTTVFIYGKTKEELLAKQKALKKKIVRLCGVEDEGTYYYNNFIYKEIRCK